MYDTTPYSKVLRQGVNAVKRHGNKPVTLVIDDHGDERLGFIGGGFSPALDRLHEELGDEALLFLRETGAAVSASSEKVCKRRLGR